MISRTEIENFNKKFDVVGMFVEHDGKILLLHRQDHKPEGNTWSIPGGKVNNGEDLQAASAREVEEETGIKRDKDTYTYFESYYVRYPSFDYRYHIYHLLVDERPPVILNTEENKDHVWVTPKEALELELIPHEDDCIKWFYKI